LREFVPAQLLESSAQSSEPWSYLPIQVSPEHWIDILILGCPYCLGKILCEVPPLILAHPPFSSAPRLALLVFEKPPNEKAGHWRQIE
jgi:hypothetical protein